MRESRSGCSGRFAAGGYADEFRAFVVRLFQGLLFLFFGVGLLVVVYRSLESGWLPCGPRGLQGRLEFRRKGQPIRYWLMFVAYGVAGICLTVYSLRILAGSAAPLPLQ